MFATHSLFLAVLSLPPASLASQSPTPNPAPQAPAASGTARPRAGATDDISLFYGALAPYGEWSQLPPYGWVWTPRGTPLDWRPYTRGHWAPNDEAGWVWISDEPWGWATYHYGRWTYADELGWTWVPGAVWAPAWVSWRSNPEMIGWAPLPPSAAWDAQLGFSTSGLGFAVDIDPFGWSFCGLAEFGAPHLESVVVTSARNITLIQRTSDLRPLTCEHGVVVNHGLDEPILEHEHGRPFEHIRIRDEARFGAASEVKAGEVGMFRRVLSPAPTEARPAVENQLEPRAARGEEYEAFRKRETNVAEQQRAATLAKLHEIHAGELSRAQSEAAIRQLREQHAAELEQLERHHERALHVIEHRARLEQRHEERPHG